MALASRILVVEDDPHLCDTLLEQLGPSPDFDVDAVATVADALARIADDHPDLIIMDEHLSADGLDGPSTVRDGGFRGPIILLARTPEDCDAIEPDAAVDECIAKPFKFAVLLGRIRAQLRAYEAQEDAIPIGTFAFRPGAKLLVADDGAQLRLTEKEVAILRFLHRAGQRTVGRDVLLQGVWGYNPAVTTHTLETHVYRLRQKIEADPSAARILVTEPGGYRLLP